MTPSLLQRLQADLNSARKAGEKTRALVIATTISEARNREIELKRELTDDDTIDVIRRAIKKRRESIEMYAKAGRDDLAAKERDEAAELEGYLPAQAADDELRTAVAAAIAGGARQIGAVMGRVTPQFKGRAEGSRISAIAKEELARVQ